MNFLNMVGNFVPSKDPVGLTVNVPNMENGSYSKSVSHDYENQFVVELALQNALQ